MAKSRTVNDGNLKLQSKSTKRTDTCVCVGGGEAMGNKTHRILTRIPRPREVKEFQVYRE